MNKRKLERAWKIFEEIGDEIMRNGYIDVGYRVGGAVQPNKEAESMLNTIREYSSFPLDAHPDLSLSAAGYAEALHAFVTPELMEKLKLKHIIIPREEIAERLKRMEASYIVYFGLVIVLNNWCEKMMKELAARNFDVDNYSGAELDALMGRTTAIQAYFYLSLLEEHAAGGR